jgi:hypothetical protein
MGRLEEFRLYCIISGVKSLTCVGFNNLPECLMHSFPLSICWYKGTCYDPDPAAGESVFFLSLCKTE